jgi:peptidoglycan/xylan/chitin deacetylase (PgdA/CDA1 family)
MVNMNLKSAAVQLAAFSGFQNFSKARPETSLTTLLFHSFFFGDESKRVGRERLRRQLDWARSKYAPLGLTSALKALTTKALPKYPLLITIDDVRTDLLDVYDVFEDFHIPLAVFVCAGWASRLEAAGEETQLARIVTALEWYQGPDFVLALGDPRLSLRISPSHRTAAIEQILATQDKYRNHLEEMIRRLGDKPKSGDRVCTWSELSDLVRKGAQFGCHSVSHVPLGSASELRIAFEIHESKRLTELRLGKSSVFAYPYGSRGSFNVRTTQVLHDADFEFAFLTHSDFANAATDPLHLPRIALPDRIMSLSEFRARVKGGGIVLQRAKEAMMKANPFRN